MSEKKAIPPSKRKKLQRRQQRVQKAAAKTAQRPKAPPKPRQTTNKQKRLSDEAVAEAILLMCHEAGLEGAVKPDVIARALQPEQWQSVLKRLRRTAVKQALAGHLTILRKGVPADPEEFKGLVKFQITPQGMARAEALLAQRNESE